MKLIWATRGKAWGFRFLERGGFEDPLLEYEAAFAGFENETEVCELVGDRLALRFPDPLGRRDAAGRVIPHDFVVFPPDSAGVQTIGEGIEAIWHSPDVSSRFAQIWDIDSRSIEDWPAGS